MTTKSRTLRIADLRVSVERKAIKNLHLGVYPPDGRIRIAAPLGFSDAAVRVAVVTKLRWIKKQRASFAAQAREERREMLGGESHYFLGRRYRLELVSSTGPDRVQMRNHAVEIHTKPGSDANKRAHVLRSWYREQLKAHAAPLLEKWEKLLGVSAAAWGVRRMKTKWGSCNPTARRISLNLELAKKPVRCLEYVLVHELIHLVERHHNARFVSLLDRHLPNWRSRRSELNAAPLAVERWK